MRLTVLGPPALWRGETRLDPGTPQQQAVLALLRFGDGRFVRIGELADGLWGERAPSSGEAVVRTYVSRLRRLLPDGAITARSGGYRLDPTLCTVDAHEFARLVARARGEDVTAAADRLREALALWTGPALAGVPGEAAERERARLERLKLTATQELLRLRLELGEHAAVAAEVPGLIERNRLEEPLYEIQLLALHRCGRRAEALEVYRGVHALFGDELGVGPGPRLRTLHEALLRDDEPLGDGGFGRWEAVLEKSLRRHGVPAAEASGLAALTVAAVEGAAVLCRAKGSTAPLDVVTAQLARVLTGSVRSA